MNRLKFWLLTAAVIAGAAEPSLAAETDHPLIAILCYHIVKDAASSDMTVSIKQMTEQLALLQKDGYSFVGLDRVAAFYHDHAPLPEKTAVITFDDGTTDVYTQAYPVLTKLGLPFTIFINPGFADQGHKAGFAEWPEIVDMANHGVIVGAHSQNHPFLTKPPAKVKTWADYQAWLKVQTVDSRQILEDHLKKKVDYFAVPFGIFDTVVKDYLKAQGYSLVLNVHDLTADADTDPWNLNRIVVVRSQKLDFFKMKCEALPLEFTELSPPDLSRSYDQKPELDYSLTHPELFDPASVKLTMVSVQKRNINYDQEHFLYRVKMTFPHDGAFVGTVTATAKDNKFYRGRWLALYNKAKPTFLP